MKHIFMGRWGGSSCLTLVLSLAALTAHAGDVPIPYSPLRACTVTTTYPVASSTIEGHSQFLSTLVSTRSGAIDRELLQACLGTLYAGAGTGEMLRQMPIGPQVSGTAVIPIATFGRNTQNGLVLSAQSTARAPVQESRLNCEYAIRMRLPNGRNYRIHQVLRLAQPPATPAEALGICATTTAEAAARPAEARATIQDPGAAGARFVDATFELELEDRVIAGTIRRAPLPTIGRRTVAISSAGE